MIRGIRAAANAQGSGAAGRGETRTRSLQWFETHEREMADRQLEVTAIPAPPFRERQRSEWMLGKFIECGLQQAHMDAVCNVIGLLPGNAQGPYVSISAHVDTVFSETQLEVRRDGERLVGPGIADNGAGLVALLAIAAAMQAAGIKTRLPLLFLANVGEEGEGNLRGMRHFFEDPQWRTQIDCMLALDGAGTDTIVTEALGSRRFEVSISGPGGHSWSDFGTPESHRFAGEGDRAAQPDYPARQAQDDAERGHHRRRNIGERDSGIGADAGRFALHRSGQDRCHRGTTSGHPERGY